MEHGKILPTLSSLPNISVWQISTSKIRLTIPPLGSGPLANQIGLKAESQAACALLQGTIPPLPPSTFAVTSQILEALSRPLSLTPQIISASISLDQFISTYKAAQEITSSSFSGRHVGRTKAILEDTSLCKLHSSMMSIPYMTGFSSSR